MKVEEEPKAPKDDLSVLKVLVFRLFVFFLFISTILADGTTRKVCHAWGCADSYLQVWLVRAIVAWTPVFACSRTWGLSLRRWCRPSVKSVKTSMSVSASICQKYSVVHDVFISFTECCIHTYTRTRAQPTTVNMSCCRFFLWIFGRSSRPLAGIVLPGADWLFMIFSVDV